MISQFVSTELSKEFLAIIAAKSRMSTITECQELQYVQVIPRVHI